jgi:anti-sigma regulatory factor (Ser/Thr protein kinase)
VTRSNGAMRFKADAEPASLRRLRGELRDFLAGAGASEALHFEVTLAVSEAANNVLQHAFRSRSTGGGLIVAASAEDGAIRVLVSDTGGGLVPRSDSPGAGLGLPLMAQLSDELNISQRDGGGTEVELIWHQGA